MNRAVETIASSIGKPAAVVPRRLLAVDNTAKRSSTPQPGTIVTSAAFWRGDWRSKHTPGIAQGPLFHSDTGVPAWY